MKKYLNTQCLQVTHFKYASESHRGLVKIQTAEPHAQSFWFGRSKVESAFLNRFPGNAATAGMGTTLWEQFI